MSIRLTEILIGRVATPTREVMQYDSVVPGLFIRISPRGVRSWGFASRLRDGRKIKMKLGRWPAVTLVEARSQARALTGEVEVGRDPRGSSVPTVALTMHDLAAAFVEGWCRPRNRHWKQQQRALESIVCDEWGWRDRIAESITRREIGEQLRGMIGLAGKRGIRANRVHAVLHTMFRWATGQGYVTSMPMLGMSKPSPERVRNRVLSDNEVCAVWVACHRWRRGTFIHPMAGAVLLALLTGQRMGEVVGIHRDEIGTDGVWRLPATRVKNKHPHNVPLPKLAQALLASMPDAGQCPFGGAPVGSREKKRLDRLMQIHLGDQFREWRLHDLRRTVRSGLAAAGVSWEIQHRIQNHLSPLGAMDRTYQRHDHIAEMRAGLEAWETRLIELVGNELVIEHC